MPAGDPGAFGSTEFRDRLVPGLYEVAVACPVVALESLSSVSEIDGPVMGTR